jgi:hypothetical protein
LQLQRITFKFYLVADGGAQADVDFYVANQLYKNALLSEVVLAETNYLSTGRCGRVTDEGKKRLRMVRPQSLEIYLIKVIL